MAQCLIAGFGDEKSAALASPYLLHGKPQRDAIASRMTLYQKAIHAETKPKRPGVPSGGTMKSAAAEAKVLEASIYSGG